MAEKKFLDFMDRFDGGGMGKSGDKFEGGGLLSLLGNIFATPRGSEDRAKEEALAGLLGNTRPNMRPNRPAPADPAQGMPTDQRLTLPGNPNGPIDDGLGPMPQRLQGDPSLGFNPANAAPVQPDPFSYSGDREAGMAGDNYRLPDDANDFGINPNVGPNPFAGMPGVGVDGRSLDGEILRDAPTGLPEVSSELGFTMPDGSSDYRAAPMKNPHQSFIEELVEMIGADEAKERLNRGEYERLYNNYVKNGYTLNY